MARAQRSALARPEDTKMLASRRLTDWALQEHKDRQYDTESERRFFEAIENPEPPTEGLKTLVRNFGKYLANDK